MADVNIKFLLDSLSRRNETEDDKLFRKRTKRQIEDRDERYTLLLKHFVGVTRFRNWVKEIFKWAFMISIVVCISVLTKSFYLLTEKYVKTASIQEIIDSIPLLVTSIVSIISAVISIPVIITKYLFSTKEDKYITNIIMHTQEHDTSGRDWATKHKETDPNKKTVSEQGENNQSA